MLDRIRGESEMEERMLLGMRRAEIIDILSSLERNHGDYGVAHIERERTAARVRITSRVLQKSQDFDIIEHASCPHRYTEVMKTF